MRCLFVFFLLVTSLCFGATEEDIPSFTRHPLLSREVEILLKAYAKAHALLPEGDLASGQMIIKALEANHYCVNEMDGETFRGISSLVKVVEGDESDGTVPLSLNGETVRAKVLETAEYSFEKDAPEPIVDADLFDELQSAFPFINFIDPSVDTTALIGTLSPKAEFGYVPQGPWKLAGPSFEGEMSTNSLGPCSGIVFKGSKGRAVLHAPGPLNSFDTILGLARAVGEGLELHMAVGKLTAKSIATAQALSEIFDIPVPLHSYPAASASREAGWTNILRDEAMKEEFDRKNNGVGVSMRQDGSVKVFRHTDSLGRLPDLASKVGFGLDADVFRTGAEAHKPSTTSDLQWKAFVEAHVVGDGEIVPVEGAPVLLGGESSPDVVEFVPSDGAP